MSFLLSQVGRSRLPHIFQIYFFRQFGRDIVVPRATGGLPASGPLKQM
jgi:hypothetical protein